MKLVDPIIWEDMEGDTELEKKLNSLLTVTLISTEKTQPDRCLDVARAVIILTEDLNAIT